MLNTIGLANRARKVLIGTEMTVKTVQKGKGKVKLVLLAIDASDNTKKLVYDKCKHYGVTVLEQLPSSEISMTLGKNNIKVIGITDEGFSKLLLDQKRK